MRGGTSVLVVVTDPTQTAFDDAVVRGWQTYVNIVSVQHGVYLQVTTHGDTDTCTSPGYFALFYSPLN